MNSALPLQRSGADPGTHRALSARVRGARKAIATSAYRFGSARVVRPGSACTVLATSVMVQNAAEGGGGGRDRCRDHRSPQSRPFRRGLGPDRGFDRQDRPRRDCGADARGRQSLGARWADEIQSRFFDLPRLRNPARHRQSFGTHGVGCSRTGLRWPMPTMSEQHYQPSRKQAEQVPAAFNSTPTERAMRKGGNLTMASALRGVRLCCRWRSRPAVLGTVGRGGPGAGSAARASRATWISTRSTRRAPGATPARSATRRSMSSSPRSTRT